MIKKKNIGSWLAPLYLAITLAMISWIVTDILHDNKVWESDFEGFVERIEALLLNIALCYPAHFLALYSINYSIKKRNEDSLRKSSKEFVVVILVIIAIVNLGLAFVTYVINNDSFSWKNTAIVNSFTVPVCFLYYFFLRSRKLYQVYIDQTMELQKIKSQQLETELDYLKAQYHPHFLFNALNTVYFQINEKDKHAKETVEMLADLLRYQLYDIQNVVSLKQEVEFLKTYINFQKLRKSEKLKVTESFDIQSDEIKIHPLLFLPLVENAFKYVGGEYFINLSVKAEDDKVLFRVDNSISNQINENKKKGIGIENLKRRLEILYPSQFKLKTENRGNNFYAELIVSIKKMQA